MNAFETIDTGNKVMVDGRSKTVLSRGQKVRETASGEVWHVTLLNGVPVDYHVLYAGGPKWFLYRGPSVREVVEVA